MSWDSSSRDPAERCAAGSRNLTTRRAGRRFDDGVDVVADFAAALRGAGAPRAPALRDGSGLSAANLVTPAAVVRVLAHAVRRPWGRRFVAALARPGEGTLAACVTHKEN